MSRKKLAWANKEVETFVCILGEEDVVYDVYVAAAAIDIRPTTKGTVGSGNATSELSWAISPPPYRTFAIRSVPHPAVEKRHNGAFPLQGAERIGSQSRSTFRSQSQNVRALFLVVYIFGGFRPKINEADADVRRECVLKSLIIYLGECVEDLIKEYTMSQIDQAKQELDSTTMAVFVFRENSSLLQQPKEIGIIIDVSTRAAVEAGFGVWVSRVSRQIVDTIVEEGGVWKAKQATIRT
ncbi:unnamed protein product [Boreogadus saida]